MSQSQYSSPDKVLNTCSNRTSQNSACAVPSITWPEIGIPLSKMDNKKQQDVVVLVPFKKKNAVPYFVETPIHMYNLCTQIY